MEREQIIKALECCGSRNISDCRYCPYTRETECHRLVLTNALSLINELTEENKAWQMRLIDKEEKADKAYYELACEVEDLRAENERLRDTAYRLECEVHRERANTVRKMQERLTLEFDRMHKNNFMTPEVRQWIIDQIVKEMLKGIE